MKYILGYNRTMLQLQPVKLGIVHIVCSAALISMPAMASDSSKTSNNEIDEAISQLLTTKQAYSPNFNPAQKPNIQPYLHTESNISVHHANQRKNGNLDTASQAESKQNKRKTPAVLAASYATKAALNKSAQKCALYVRRALNKAGYNNFKPQSSAYMYENIMPQIGFSKISQEHYKPAVGDIIVWRKKASNPHGHIQIYNGEQWVSDFKQPSMYIYGQNHNGYTIWRDKKHYSAVADDGVRLALND